MTDAEIKLHRTESVLKELIPEALSTLSDEMLRGLCVTEVKCRKGRYDADVYLDKMMLDDKEQRYVLSHLRKVHKHLQNHCAGAEGWYRCPNFHFKFDDQLEKQNHMEALFAQVEKELNKGKKDDE